MDVSRAVVRREGEFNPDRGELSAGVAGEKFGPESVTGVERRVACHERKDAEGGAENAWNGARGREPRERQTERERASQRERERDREWPGWRLRGAGG